LGKSAKLAKDILHMKIFCEDTIDLDILKEK